ncbi:hypothetical protein [Catellatospora sichuanensis]|uniref:hypothetical protein n=1 Tax=Catellatospora sichuanensis TaxID=1969805 RepID=UPI0011821509|nr:hypothetical protein [Catellatospora sichuanensis]
MRRIITVGLVLWLIVGVVAAAQRDYFTGTPADCDRVTTIAATALAGPLNYVGADPSVSC